jgi:hypothetical protein
MGQQLLIPRHSAIEVAQQIRAGLMDGSLDLFAVPLTAEGGDASGSLEWAEIGGELVGTIICVAAMVLAVRVLPSYFDWAEGFSGFESAVSHFAVFTTMAFSAWITASMVLSVIKSALMATRRNRRRRRKR